MQRCSRNVNAESGFSIDVITMHVLSLALCYYYIINICSCGTLVNSCNNSCCQWCVHRDNLHWFRDRKCIIEVTFRLLHEWRRNKKILTRNTPLRSEMRRKSRLWRSRADPIIDLRQTLPPRVLGGGGLETDADDAQMKLFNQLNSLQSGASCLCVTPSGCSVCMAACEIITQ